MEKIAEKLKARREDLGLTLDEVAALVGFLGLFLCLSRCAWLRSWRFIRSRLPLCHF